MNTETQSSAHYARRRRHEEDPLAPLKQRTRAGQFGFIITVGTTRWAVTDASAWQFMKVQIVRAVERASEEGRPWGLTDFYSDSSELH